MRPQSLKRMCGGDFWTNDTSTEEQQPAATTLETMSATAPSSTAQLVRGTGLAEYQEMDTADEAATLDGRAA